MLSLLQAPLGEPISPDEAKAHARIEVDTDGLVVQGLIRAATDFAEWFTQRALLTQEWELLLDDFPRRERAIELPKPPLQEVIEVTYTDPAGEEQVWPEDSYRVIAPVGPAAGRGLVILKTGERWPLVRNEPYAVRVHFRAGYGGMEHVPQGIKNGLLIHVAELYENRESTVLTGAVLQEVPFSVKATLWPYVVDKLGI